MYTLCMEFVHFYGMNKYITKNPNVILLGIINATIVHKILRHHLKIYKDDAKTLSLYNAVL